ncbi:hypothetical protein [Serratia sp. CY76391]|uniref:hypothetical protein n=1 Tax=Serratia sp. CY76391 TaxID=3383681 RepID=UPI003F9F7241
MENKFDFELEGKDDLSGTLKNLEDVVKKMLPALDQADKKLKLGGQETVDGLDKMGGKLSRLSTFAKSGVQYFGDMVPPLKMVGGLAERYGGVLARLGGVGVVAYGAVQGVKALAGGLSAAGQEAYNLGVQAKNSGMSVHDLTQVAGAMEILGADTDTARQSVVDLSRSLTDALNNRKADFVGMMNQINAPIYERADHTADTMQTLEKLAEIFPTLSAQKQKTVADFLGLNDATLALLRDGVHYKELLAKSDKFGLTISNDQIQKLQEINSQENEFFARLDGLTTQLKLDAYNWTIGGHAETAMNNVEKSKNYDKDSAVSFYHGNQQEDILHRARRDADFKNTLTFGEGVELALGHPGKSLQEKLNKRYLASWKAQSLAADVRSIAASSHPTAIPPQYAVNQNSLQVKNNNPWDLNFAGQQWATKEQRGEGSRFAHFDTPEHGVMKADDQLLRYYQGKSKAAHYQPLSTLRGIISTASPKKDHNNTDAMIAGASKELGISPDSLLDLNNVFERARVLHALFNQEGNNPYGVQQIQQIIQSKTAAGDRYKDEGLIPSMRLPGQPSIITQEKNQELVSALTKAIMQAQKEGGSQVELVITNGNTGEKRVVTLPPGGKVTTSMNAP